MRGIKLVLLCLLALGVTGCACRTKQVGPGSDNIGRAQPGVELQDVNFAFDSYALSDLAKSILKKNAEWLQTNSAKTVQIEGHCDERGTAEYNMALGARRARAVYDYMRSLGIDSARMSTISYGKELPLDPRHNEEAWARNRRAHFNINN